MNNYFAGFQDAIYYDNQRNREVRAAIWYPTQESPEQSTYFNAYTGYVKHHAVIDKAQFPLILISHGSKGHRINQHYLAEYLAKQGFIVAAVEHPFDTSFDDSQSDKQTNLINRPLDVLLVIKRLMSDSFYKTSLDEKNIGMIGHSFGGFTALLMAGIFPDYLDCFNKNKVTAYLKNIKGITLLAPALSELFDTNCAKTNIPILFFKSEFDEALGSSDLNYLPLFTNKKLINLKNTGHYIYLMKCPDKLKDICPVICVDKGMQREEIHPILKKNIAEFFNNTLKMK
ncbi:MAG: hypothetical protein HKM04_00235 [Legionellales bacterium]|nr:hypothetical protein [Legionellales bacterium]